MTPSVGYRKSTTGRHIIEDILDTLKKNIHNPLSADEVRMMVARKRTGMKYNSIVCMLNKLFHDGLVEKVSAGGRRVKWLAK